MSYRHAFQESVCPTCRRMIVPGAKVAMTGEHLECYGTQPAPVASTFPPAPPDQVVPFDVITVYPSHDVALSQDEPPPVKRRYPGRPKGSKNKPKDSNP